MMATCPYQVFRNRRIQRFLLLVLLLSGLPVFGLHRRNRLPHFAKSYSQQGPAVHPSDMTSVAADIGSDLQSHASEASVLPQALEPSRSSNKVGAFDYAVAKQVDLATSLMSEQKSLQSIDVVDVDDTSSSGQLAMGAPDPTRVALLLETRALPVLPALLSHFVSVLPDTWTIRFIGSPASTTLVSSSASLRDYMNTRRLSITNLPTQYSIETSEQISATLTDLTFYRDFLAPAEWLLVFQADSIACAASSLSLDDWVERNYTWVGAPWHMDNPYGGNGGLSLSYVPAIIKLLEQEQRAVNDVWEDRWLTDRLGIMEGTIMPGPDITKLFSVETIWADKPFGYHLRASGKREHLDQGIWGDEARKQMIMEYCPEVKLILDNDLSTPMEEEAASSVAPALGIMTEVAQASVHANVHASDLNVRSVAVSTLSYA